MLSRRRVLLGAIALVGAMGPSEVAAATAPVGRGIFLNPRAMAGRKQLLEFVARSKACKINTFVPDLWGVDPMYERNVKTMIDEGLRYVPRVVVFPYGGSEDTVRSPTYWERRWKLIKQGLALGATRIQLDYVRYSADREPSAQNAKDITRVIQFFSERIRGAGATLEVDIFGEAAEAPSERIGQNLELFAPHIDGVCPMVYPSHYKPYATSWQRPYEIVYRSISKAAKTLAPHGTRIDAYVEMFNYRKKMTGPQRAIYVRKQVQGAIAGGAQGWYAWSAMNSYGLLFDLLDKYGDKFERA